MVEFFSNIPKGLGSSPSTEKTPPSKTYLDNGNAFLKLTRILHTLMLSTLKLPESGKIDTVKKMKHIFLDNKDISVTIKENVFWIFFLLLA